MESNTFNFRNKANIYENKIHTNSKEKVQAKQENTNKEKKKTESHINYFMDFSQFHSLSWLIAQHNQEQDGDLY